MCKQFLRPGIAFRVGEREANDHPAAGTSSLSGHHAIVLLGESKNEPGSRATLWALRAADAVVFADKDQMLGSILREADLDGPSSIVRERILEGVGEKFIHDDAEGNDEIGRQRKVLDLGPDDNWTMAGEGLANISRALP